MLQLQNPHEGRVTRFICGSYAALYLFLMPFPAISPEGVNAQWALNTGRMEAIMEKSIVRVGSGRTAKRDPWFEELLDLASEGNPEAIHDLWLSYGYDYASERRAP